MFGRRGFLRKLSAVLASVPFLGAFVDPVSATTATGKIDDASTVDGSDHVIPNTADPGGDQLTAQMYIRKGDAEIRSGPIGIRAEPGEGTWDDVFGKLGDEAGLRIKNFVAYKLNDPDDTTVNDLPDWLLDSISEEYLAQFQ